MKVRMDKKEYRRSEQVIVNALLLRFAPPLLAPLIAEKAARRAVYKARMKRQRRREAMQLGGFAGSTPELPRPKGKGPEGHLWDRFRGEWVRWQDYHQAPGDGGDEDEVGATKEDFWYEIESVEAVDLFPQTSHVEVVALFRRREVYHV